MLYIGVDLGTSAVKLLLMDESGSFTFRRDVFQYDCYGGMRDHELCTMSSPRQLFSNTDLKSKK